MPALSQLQNIARRLAGGAHRPLPGVVQVVCNLDAQDVDELLNGKQLNPTRSDALLRATSLDLDEFVDVVELLRADLAFSEDAYREISHLRLTRQQEQEVHAFLLGPRAASQDVIFALHEELSVWSVDSDTMCDLVIEDHGVGDNFTYFVLAYLIRHNRAYSSTLSLLSASFNENWHHWESLWNCY